jgi:tetratricopeptide (TPR) repeat protein
VKKGTTKTLVIAATIAVAFLLLLEMALNLAGTGFTPKFFLRGEDGFLHANRHFGRLFFPERLVREGVAVRLADPKPAGTFRIFVLGESAAMGFPSPRFGFPRVLEVMLREAFPGKNIEVVNVAMAGINSHAVRRIAQECAELQPDAFVIYMGNNDVVGPFGPGTVFGGTTTSLAQARMAMALRTTKTGQLLDTWMDKLGGRDKAKWGGMGMFTNQRVPQDHAAMPAVYANFRSNLRDILHSTSGKPTVLCTVAVKLEDFPPLAGEEARRVYSEAEAAEERGDAAKADALFSQARDLDELRFRADSDINRIIREEKPQANVTLVDAEEIFTARSMSEKRGLFWEHVHLDFPGNYLLARSVADALVPSLRHFFATEPLPWAQMDTIARKLGYTPAEELVAVSDIAKMMTNPPFTSQPGNAERWQQLAARARALEEARKSTDLATLETELREEVAKHPDDPWQRVALVATLDARDKRAESLEQKRAIAKLIPYDITALCNLGRNEMAAGNLGAARTALRQASQLDRHFARPVIDLAGCEMLENNPEEATSILESFLRANPENTEALVALAQISRHENNPGAARTYLERALRVSPENAAAKAELDALNLPLAAP